MTAIVKRTIADLKTRLQAVPSLATKIFHVYSEDELMDQTKQLRLPAVGIVYGGMGTNTDISTQRQQSSPINASAIMDFNLIIMVQQSTMHGIRQEDQALDLLDEVRDTLQGQKGPSNHPYRFEIEGSAELRKGTVVWVQRWTNPVQLVPKKTT